MNTTAKAMDYVKRIGSPYLGVYPDVGNLTNGVEPEGGCTEPGGLASLVASDLETGGGTSSPRTSRRRGTAFSATFSPARARRLPVRV